MHVRKETGSSYISFKIICMLLRSLLSNQCHRLVNPGGVGFVNLKGLISVLTPLTCWTEDWKCLQNASNSTNFYYWTGKHYLFYRLGIQFYKLQPFPTVLTPPTIVYHSFNDPEGHKSYLSLLFSFLFPISSTFFFSFFLAFYQRATMIKL